MARKRSTEWVRVGSINTHPSYQRALRRAAVNRIVANFDPDLLGLPQLARREDGTYWVIDGQHRVAALLSMGWADQQIECQIIEGVDVSDEAHRFLGLNETVKVQAIDKFQARVIAGEPIACEINDIISDAGFEVRIAKAEGAFAAVRAAEVVYRGGKMSGEDKHPDVLRWVFDVLTRAWGIDSSAVNGFLIHGLGLLRLRGDDIDSDRLVHKLATRGGGADKVIGDARGLAGIYGGSLPSSVAELIVNTYNTGLRAKRLPNFRRAA